MHINVMDENFQRETIVDTYKSFIWTERYKAAGDFELIVKADHKYKSVLKIDKFITLDEQYSTRVMRILEHENTQDESGERYLKITGESAEYLLRDRPAINTFDSLTALDKWEVTGKPQEIMLTLFERAYEFRPVNVNDSFPYLTGSYIDPFGTIPFPQDEVTIAFDPGDLYSAMTKVADTYDLGFRTVINSDGSSIEGIEFDVYTGNNRTRDQLADIPIVFSSALDSLSKTTSYESTSSYKNVAYVLTKNGKGIVYATGTDESVSGADRRVLTVIASDIELPAGAELDAAIQQRGIEELAKTRRTVAFDGEIPQEGPYGYDSGGSWGNKSNLYQLGDLVEQISDEGFVTRMKVTEQIFVSDEEGDRSYPTLEVDTVATPGSWASRSATQVWSGVPDTETWGSLT